MKRPYSRYVERRRREIANERDELTSKIAAMIPEVEAIAKNSPNAEAREVAQKWLALVTPEERSRTANNHFPARFWLPCGRGPRGRAGDSTKPPTNRRNQMNTASKEWTERVAARNAIETAKATKRPEPVQTEFLWNAIDLDAPRASQPEGGAK